jgi:DNA-binding transcriptional LysR family regulator
MLPEVVAKNGFSLDRIATLCGVIDAGSIAAAAGPSPSRQSQFSRQIKELEEAVGGKLFERVGKTLRPTPLGQQLARMSRIFFGAVADLASQEAEKPGLLNVGGGEGLLRWLFVPSMSALRGLSPPIHCRVRSLRSAEVIQELELGRIDVGLVRKSAVPENHSTETIGTFEFVFAVPRQLLRSRTGEEVYEGKPIPFAELMGDGQLATTAREISMEAGIQLNRVIQAETLSLLLAAVEHGDAAAFLPTVAAANLPSDRFAVLRFKDMNRLSRETVLVWLPEVADQKPVVRQSIRVLSRSLRQTMLDADHLAASDCPLAHGDDSIND